MGGGGGVAVSVGNLIDCCGVSNVSRIYVTAAGGCLCVSGRDSSM